MPQAEGRTRVEAGTPEAAGTRAAVGGTREAAADTRTAGSREVGVVDSPVGAAGMPPAAVLTVAVAVRAGCPCSSDQGALPRCPVSVRPAVAWVDRSLARPPPGPP